MRKIKDNLIERNPNLIRRLAYKLQGRSMRAPQTENERCRIQTYMQKANSSKDLGGCELAVRYSKESKHTKVVNTHSL